VNELALLGGSPVRTDPYPAWPIVEDRDVAAVADVIRSGRWGRLGATQVREFEQAFAAYQGSAYGLAVNSGTAALELALNALQLPRATEVIVPAYTYMATATAVLRAGLVPVFVDIEADTYNLDPSLLEPSISASTSAILPVHFGGLACDMETVLRVAERHKLRVIEDAAHAHGARWNDRGLGTIGDIGCFSFQASKNLNAGEGGILLTDDDRLYTRAIEHHDLWAGGMLEREGQLGQGSLRSGQTWDFPFAASSQRVPNYQAVLLHQQLGRLEAQTKRRDANAAYLDGLLSDIAGIEPRRQDSFVTRNSHHLFIARYTGNGFDQLPRDLFIKALNAEGIPITAGYGRPLHRTSLFQDRNGELSRCWPRNDGVPDVDYSAGTQPIAERLCRSETLWLSQNVFLDTQEGMDHIVDAIEKIRLHTHKLNNTNRS
jgi:dTDP-4-amino-4,6-dideoxygalactose transaminase